MGAKVQAAEMRRLRWGGSGRLVPGGQGLLPGPDLVWDLSRSPGQLESHVVSEGTRMIHMELGGSLSERACDSRGSGSPEGKGERVSMVTCQVASETGSPSPWWLWFCVTVSSASRGALVRGGCDIQGCVLAVSGPCDVQPPRPPGWGKVGPPMLSPQEKLRV